MVIAGFSSHPVARNAVNDPASLPAYDALADHLTVWERAAMRLECTPMDFPAALENRTRRRSTTKVSRFGIWVPPRVENRKAECQAYATTATFASRAAARNASRARDGEHLPSMA